MGRSVSRSHASRITIIRAVLAAGVGLAASTVGAGVNELTALGPEGGEIFDVEFHSDDPAIVYMAATPGFLRSTDGGATWQLTRKEFRNFKPVLDVAVDPTDSDRVYLAAGEEMLVSHDAGLTFSSSRPPNRQGLLIRVDCGADGTVYAPDGAKMYRSQDRGATWQSAGTFPQPHDLAHSLAVHPTDSRIVYVALFGEGILRSQDSGATWAPVSANAAILQTMHVAIDRTDPLRVWAATTSGVYASVNAGADWTQTLAEFTPRVEIDPANPQRVYAMPSPAGTVMRTLDGGATWSALPQHFGNASISGLAIHPTEPQRMISFSDGVWVSSDTGALWTRGNTGLIATGVRSIDLVRGSSSRYVATRYSGIHRLDDNNVPRAVDNAWLGILSTPANVEISDLVVAPTQTLDVLVTIFAANQVARSVDGGARWVSVARPAGNAVPYSLALPPGAPVTLYLGTSEGVFSSVDLGDHWAPRNTGLPGGTLIARLVSTSDPTVIYALGVEPNTGIGRVFRTADGAQSWAATASPAGFITGLAVHPTDPQTVYVGREQGLYRTTDGGVTWTALNVDNDHYQDVAVDPSDTRVIYAAASQRVVRSSDSGATWERLATMQNSYDFATAVAVDPVERNAVLVGTFGSGLKQLSVRPDLQLTITAPTSLTANVTGAFTVQVQNRGPYHARDVRIVAQLPAAAANVSVSSGAAACSVAGQQAVCTIDSLKANTNATISLNAAVSSGSLSVQASVTSHEADLNAADNSASAQVAVIILQADTGGGGGGGGGAMVPLLLVTLLCFAGIRRALADG